MATTLGRGRQRGWCCWFGCHIRHHRSVHPAPAIGGSHAGPAPVVALVVVSLFLLARSYMACVRLKCGFYGGAVRSGSLHGWLARSKEFARVSCHGFSLCFPKMAIRHMRDVTPVVTLLWAGVSQGARRKPLPAMLSTRDTARAHPHKGVEFG
jgi:hypothetical protein